MTYINIMKYKHTTHTYIMTCIYNEIYMIACIYHDIHTYIHACIHTYIHSYIHTFIHSYIHSYIHTFIHTYIHTCIHTYNDTMTCIYIYIHNGLSWVSIAWKGRSAEGTLSRQCAAKAEIPDHAGHGSRGSRFREGTSRHRSVRGWHRFFRQFGSRKWVMP